MDNEILVPEEREIQASLSVGAAEEETEGVLRIRLLAAIRAADTQSRIDLELVHRTVYRIDLLDGDGAFPRDTA
ncbi:MAG: hypothetical protein IKX19_07590, partial [Clostridia bacterium]|nr:hypothetical protein [Clostridia bacterium]